MNQVTFATTIWAKTYPYMLGSEGMIARNLRMLRDTQFEEYILAVNNGVPDSVLTSQLFRHLDSAHVANRAAEKYKIDGIDQGFWYSAAPLAAIMACDTPYLLFIADDVELIRSYPGWVQGAIENMRLDPMILVTSPRWHKSRVELLLENPENRSTGDRFEMEWLKTRGFSDHCFLINVARFREDIYNETNPASDAKYPVAGAFEKRIGAYMANHGLWRQVALGAQWQHESYAGRDEARPRPTI